MVKPITFCIATANNEKEYIKLLLKSLQDHTQISLHEILIFIDSDNQNTYDMLLDYQKHMPNMRICKNPNKYPIGSQRNVSVMFNSATNDVVCYLQSDMVVGKDFDIHVSNSINEKVVLSCARIEPPLHPESPEKIVKDFGIIPEEFDYTKFNEFVDDLQKQNRPNMPGHFAPFAIYKKTWFEELGGFDTQFRCSREDSDTIIRMELAGLDMVQSWNACVYHFTCVSSRGKDWFKSDIEAKYKNELQSHADHQELKRFIRKWGFFGHHPRPVYNIAFNINLDRYVDFNILKFVEPYCKKLYLNNPAVASSLISQVEFEAHYYSNLRWNYPSDYWVSRKHLFNPTNFADKIICGAPDADVVVSFNYSDFVNALNQELQNVIENMQYIVDNNEVGTFTYGPLTIEIKQKNDISKSYKHINCSSILTEDVLTFV